MWEAKWVIRGCTILHYMRFYSRFLLFALFSITMTSDNFDFFNLTGWSLSLISSMSFSSNQNPKTFTLRISIINLSKNTVDTVFIKKRPHLTLISRSYKGTMDRNRAELAWFIYWLHGWDILFMILHAISGSINEHLLCATNLLTY